MKILQVVNPYGWRIENGIRTRTLSPAEIAKLVEAEQKHLESKKLRLVKGGRRET